MSDQGLKVDSFSVTVGGESGNTQTNDNQLDDGDSSNPMKAEQTDEFESEFQETSIPFIYDGNQSISVLA